MAPADCGLVGWIVFANLLIDGFIKTDAPNGQVGQIRLAVGVSCCQKQICETQDATLIKPATFRRATAKNCPQKIFVKHKMAP